MTIRLIPAVLSGGSGTRLWPLSTEAMPKQFHALGSHETMIQATVRRLAAGTEGLDVLAPLVIGNRRHGAMIEQQLGAVGVTPGGVVLEPFGRNSAAAAGIAALLAQEIDPGALVLLMSADAMIEDSEGFARTIARAAPVALDDHIVLFGVEPTHPETGYGYIQAGEPIAAGVSRVQRFAEKPNATTAQAYIDSGDYLWNAGIFLFSPAMFLRELDAHAPDVASACRHAFATARRRGTVVDLDDDAFARVPSISVDYAVMERTARAAVTPIGVPWADIGSWSELWRLSPRSEQGNVARGETVIIETTDSVVWSQGRTVGVIGVADLIIVATEDAVIVLPKHRAQDVKLLVEQVKAKATEKGA